MVRISEVFGPTIQGEGPHTGQRVAFVRFADCNLACSWCDTPYSWDWERYDKNDEVKDMTVLEIVKQIESMDAPRVVVTGGEPLMQQPAITELHDASGLLIDIETNGTIIPASHLIASVDLFAVSPKLSNSGDRESKRIKPQALEALNATGKACFKFVASTPADLDEIDAIVSTYELDNVWVMPFGASRETHLTTMQALTPSIVERGWNLSPRLHILVWDTKRGV